MVLENEGWELLMFGSGRDWILGVVRASEVAMSVVAERIIVMRDILVGLDVKDV